MKGRLTIPTDVDVEKETLEALEAWGADAVRDADGTEFPASLAKPLKERGVKIYATYYTTRKDNAWAAAHPEEVQQCYVMSGFNTAAGTGPLRIPLLEGISADLLAVNERDDMRRWWEVIDRTTGEVCGQWRYERGDKSVVVEEPRPFHEYTVSFLCYIIWDPVHMYNATVNEWEGVERQVTFDVRQPETREWSKGRLRAFLRNRPYVDVVRWTTFFHQFTLIFDQLRREKYVDWYGYSASVSPYILDKFEKEAGYKFRPEFIIDQGYHNGQYRVPSKEYRDFMAFQRREVAALAKELVDITHEEGRESMMFLGDHFIGTEPYCPEFRSIGLDAVVGSVGSGATLRLISDIPGVRYTEGRFLPYFFPDTFYEGGNPLAEARDNWLTARRAILRKPIDRIGYGGYLKLALRFPAFVEYVKRIAGEFRLLYDNIHGLTPVCSLRAAVLNAWGAARSWGCHMVHHARVHKFNAAYAGVMEALSGLPVDVKFLSFEDVRANPAVLDNFDCLINVGDADTAHTGGEYWEDAGVTAAIRGFIAGGRGFVGVGEPSGHQWQGRFFQLAASLGVEMERGFTLGYGKYNTERVQSHYIMEGFSAKNGEAGIDFGEGKRGVYALPGASVLAERGGGDVQAAASSYFAGRAVYISGLPYSPANSRFLYRALLWAAGREEWERIWYSSNPSVEIHAYKDGGGKIARWCAVNNSKQEQSAVVWDGGGEPVSLKLAADEARWFE